MNCREVTRHLDDYVDGELPALTRDAIAAHLRACDTCAAAHAAVARIVASARQLRTPIAPHRDLWPELERKIRTAPAYESAPSTGWRVPAIRWLLPLAAAASVAIAMRFGETPAARPHRTEDGWAVAAVAGTPRLGSRSFQGEASLKLGQWLETDATSRAKVAVGAIGEVRVEPNSRLRLVNASPTEHRLELARGGMRALIWAPPRLFFVNTPSATAVDLGCAYTLNVDDEGAGELHVTSGYVALEHGERESIIPAGAMCLTRPGVGPGTPFAADAPAALRSAVIAFDFERGSSAALAAILNHIRDADVVTLWHLLARTSDADRMRVYETLARLRPAPAGVTRDGILAGDLAMRREWARSLGLMW